MIWKKMAVIVIPAIALTLGTSGVAQAQNLVINGDFEQTSSSFGPGDKVAFPSAGLTAWTGGANLTFLDAPGTADNPSLYLAVYGPFPATSPTGGNFVEADGDPNYSGAFSQTINGLTAGQTYEVSFYQAAGQQLNFTGPTTERWMVSLGSSSQLSSIFSLPQGGVGPWEKQAMIFTATGASEALTFLAVGTPGGAPPISFLDGVSMQSVPEPASVSLMVFGMVGLGVVYLRRRAMAATV